MAQRLMVSAVIPTRGDVDLGPIIDRLREYPEIREIIIELRGTVFSRFQGAATARYPLIYTQDDDCITDIRPLLEKYRQGMLARPIINAMTSEHAANYTGRETLIGFGALFDRVLVHVLDEWDKDELFLREADRVFTSLLDHQTVYPQIEILDCAYENDRLFKQPDHMAGVAEIRQRISDFLEHK